MSVPADFIEQFCTFLLVERRLAQNSVAAYRADLEGFDAWAKKEQLTLEQLTQEKLIDFLKWTKQQGARTRTLARKTTTLRLFCSFLLQRCGLPHNPAQYLQVPTPERSLPRYLTEQEVHVLLEAAQKDSSPAGQRNYAMLQCMYATGMRVSELVSLTTDQLDFIQGFVLVRGKGEKERMVPLPHQISAALQTYVTDVRPLLLDEAQTSTLCFPLEKRAGRPLSRQTFWRIIKQLLQLAGIAKAISPHSLRHSIATHLLARGVDIRSLQVLLGHERIETVERYTQVTKDHLRDLYDKKHPRS